MGVNELRPELKSARLLATGTLVLLLLVVCDSRPSASTQTSGGHSLSGLTRVLSPSVVATIVMEYPEKTTPEFIVLWRGSAGWWSRQSRGRGSSMYGADKLSLEESFGGVSLSLTFDRLHRTLAVQNMPIELRGRNVVLLDNVDSPNGPKLVSMLSVPIQPTPANPWGIELTLRQSAEIVTFLQCDIVLSGPAAVLIKQSCDAVLAK